MNKYKLTEDLYILHTERFAIFDGTYTEESIFIPQRFMKFTYISNLVDVLDYSWHFNSFIVKLKREYFI